MVHRMRKAHRTVRGKAHRTARKTAHGKVHRTVLLHYEEWLELSDTDAEPKLPDEIHA